MPPHTAPFLRYNTSLCIIRKKAVKLCQVDYKTCPTFRNGKTAKNMAQWQSPRFKSQLSTPQYGLYIETHTHHTPPPLLFVFFKTGFVCVALTALALTLYTRLASNLELYLPLFPQCWVKGVLPSLSETQLLKRGYWELEVWLRRTQDVCLASSKFWIHSPDPGETGVKH